MQEFYTYLYRDPKDGTPIYVGKGKDGRATTHLQKRTNRRLNNLLNKRQREGFVVEPIINYEVDEQTALEMEKFWISFFGREDLGFGSLFNLTDGGEGAVNHSTEARTKMSIAGKKQRGRSKSTEHRDKIAEANKRRGPPSEETKQRISAALIGIKRSEETKAKMSASAALREFGNNHHININN